MSIFPTKILAATDGSEDSQLAARTAVELAQQTSSELHVVYVLPWPDQGVRDLWGFDASARCRRSQGARETEGAGRGHRSLGRGGC
jgi:nucleotide-binding universal stress UspA family protein